MSIGEIHDIPDISLPGSGEPTAWFLGPRAENRALLSELINAALKHIYEFRQSYLPGDPEVITEQVKTSESFRATHAEMLQAYEELLDYLRDKALPFFSLRYQGHMLWDNTLPAIAGYFAGMLHNPNNCSVQASASTTPLAMIVGWDLCKMLGFTNGEHIEPWSHITADGTLANIEATWSAREVKFLPFAVRRALMTLPQLKAARNLNVPLCNGDEINLLQAENWQLLNIKLNDTLDLPQRIANLCDISEVIDVWHALQAFTLNTRGWLPLLHDADINTTRQPVLILPSTKHYSWPKSAAVCGFGSEQIKDIHVDADARMDLDILEQKLQHCLIKQIPITMVVGVCGTTEESAVDPLQDILALREKYRSKGLDFHIHVDAAWGGYMITRIRRDFTLNNDTNSTADEEPFLADYSKVPISDEVVQNLQAIRYCDSVTVDPHKWGYIPYPAGSIVHRNSEIRKLTTFMGAYIGGIGTMESKEPNVGIFGLEGSRPGAAAASVYMSHRMIRPSVSGHGRLVGECLVNTRKFYLRLLELNTLQQKYVVVPLPRLGEPWERIQQLILDRPMADIAADATAMSLFRQLGPDQNILAYAFNFRQPNGNLNTDIDQFNAFNRAIYDAFHGGYDSGKTIHQCRFFVTFTTFRRLEYGDNFMDTFAHRLGLDGHPQDLNCLRSVIMDPYITHTVDGSYFREIIKIIDETVTGIAERAPDKV